MPIEPDSVNQLLVACQDKLLTRIRWMMGEPARRAADSMDFMGDVVAKILERQDQLSWQDPQHFLALATRIARNLIRDRVRGARCQRFESFASQHSGLPVDMDGTPSSDAASKEEFDRLIESLEELSPDDQRVIELRDFEDLPFAEVGRAMNRSENAVSLLHVRAITRLGRQLRRRSQGA